jgi:tRNA(Glu) U13 pseudouridine synthase TruD
VLSREPGPLLPFRDAVLPMPAPGATADDPAWQAALEAALAEDGLALEALVLPSALSMSFRPTRRGVLFRPTDASAAPPRPDDRNPGRFLVDLDFVLGPGLYATLIVKVATHGIGGRPAHRRGGRGGRGPRDGR